VADVPGHDTYVRHLIGVLQGRTLRGMRILVDAANGAASSLAGEVFSAAGADVVVINDEP
jgi:phosphoglucosamine mutase